MQHQEQWIWLPKNKYKSVQHTVYSAFSEESSSRYAVAEFKKNYSFNQKIVRADLRFSGDTAFRLYCNGSMVATGPASVGGDFLFYDEPCINFYSFDKTIFPNSTTLDFFAIVQMMPLHICEFSKGHGGFMLSAAVTFEDGTQELVCTDESWLARLNGAYAAPRVFNGEVKTDAFVHAELTENIWNTVTAPIPVREEYVLKTANSTVKLAAYEKKTVILNFDKIYSGFIHAASHLQGKVTLGIACRELEEEAEKKENLLFCGEQEYRGFYMHSAGNMVIEAENLSDLPAEIQVSFIVTHYPVSNEAQTSTSDTELNQVLEACKHTLKICRQTHHLDSPRHCEPLACTGDYYIETLMTPFSFGDMRLAQFDVLRTATMLQAHDGRIFHTSYSLIWVKMLYDTYMLSGNKKLLADCKNALDLLLNRFDSYIGENGLIENAPDYMFVDWVFIDGITLHHPPKALGQTCLNMFYFGALDTASKIYRELDCNASVKNCLDKKSVLGSAINSLLFDREKNSFFEGLNTPTRSDLLGEYMPQNTDKRYYLKQSNILAAYVGVCDDETAKELVKKVVNDEIEGVCQPYFMHYLLEAIYRLGLREKYTLTVLEKWKAPIKECSKGLVEGFYAPDPDYGFDHSHAWGGTPLYSLPKALFGLEIIEPGMTKLKLSPSLLGLNQAKSELLTPHGKVTLTMKKGENPQISAPTQVQIDTI